MAEQIVESRRAIQSEAPQSVGPTEPQRVPGSVLAAYSFSDGGLLVLRTAINIALGRGAPRDFVGSSTLLAAMIAQVRASATDEGVGLAVLNGIFPASARSDAAAVIESREQFQTSDILPGLSPNLDAILRLAEHIARTTRSDGKAMIGVRHLLAGLLHHEDTPPTNAHKRLVDAGVDIATKRRELADSAAAAWSVDKANVWAAFGSGRLLPSTETPEQEGATSSETVTGDASPPGGMLNTAREASEAELCLDVKEYADVLAELFSRADDGEFCFAIYGDWGRGKTFLMRKVHEALSRLNKKYEVIYFSAWKYPSAPEVWVHLYETFAKAAFDRPWHTAIPNIIRTAIAKRGSTGLLVAYAMLALSVLPVFELLRVLEPAVQLVYVGLGTTGLVWLWALARGVQKTGARLTREYLTASRHTERLGLQATIGTDLRTLLTGWMPAKPFSRGFVVGFWGITALFLLGTWLRLTGWTTVEAWTTNKFGWPLITNWQAGSAAIVVFAVLILIISAFRWVRGGGSSPARLILVVDDLDRCRPEHLLSVMESIKLLIEEPEISRRVQVAMLLEEEILKHAIFEKYGGLIDPAKITVLQTSYDADRLMRENCEKLFTASLRLPRLGKPELKDLIETFSGRRQELQKHRDALMEEERILGLRMNDKPSGVRSIGTKPTYKTRWFRGEPIWEEGPPETVYRPATKEETKEDEAKIEAFRGQANPVLAEVRRAIEAVDKILPPVSARWKASGEPPGSSPRVLAEVEVSAVLSVLADDKVQLRGSLGPRSIRAFLFRYQLARLLLNKLQIEWQPEPLARELAEQVLTRRGGKTGTAPLPPSPDDSGAEKLKRLVEQVS